ncbi:AAA family ATPase [Agarivorans sp. MS3-6]
MVEVRRDAEFAQLQSQLSLRERLITQIRFSAKFICVTGMAGSGKSSLASSVLERADFANHAFVRMPADGNGGQLRRDLLQQLIKDPLFNQNDPLFDSFQRNVKETNGPLVIVIDEAHLLPVDVLTELFEFFHHYNQLYQHPLSILLFAQARSDFEAQLATFDSNIVSFDISPLSENESFELASLLFNRAEYVAGFENQSAIEKHIASAKGNPRLIYQFVDQIVTGDIPMSEETAPNRNKLYIVIAVILCAAVAGLLVQLINDWGKSSDTNDSRIALALLEEPELAKGSMSEQTIAADSELSDAEKASMRQADDAELPSMELADELKLASQESSDGLRVVVEDEVVNKLLADQSKATSTAEKAIEISDSGNLLAEETVDSEPAALSEDSAEIANSDVSIKVTDVKSLLEAKPSQHYTLQLMALNNREKAHKFVSERQWSHQVWVYRSSANPNVPYKIIYGDFATREQAQTARNSLKQQNLDSLIKQFKQVQFELTQ